MATSGSYDFSVNCQEIIKGALRLIGAIATGETPSAAELSDGKEALNMMIKAWQAEGIGLWLNREATLFLEYAERSYNLGPTGDHCSVAVVKTEMKVAAASGAGTIDVDSITGISDGDYVGIELDDGTLQWTTVNGAPAGDTVTLTAGLTDDAAVDNHVYTYTSKIPRPIEVIEARRVYADDTEVPLQDVSRAEYMALSNKTSAGPPIQVYYDPQLTNGVLYVWQACDDVQERIRMTVKLPVEDFDANTDDADFPPEWLRALKFNLAVEIAPEYGKEPSNTVIVKAAETKDAVSGFDREQTSVFFLPDLGRG
uniref:Putative tail protein n=1 Tax=viral metagenome TaxID=1070528 RepID=A0A6M3J3D4_9ZZZZ